MAKVRLTTLLFEGLIGVDMNRECVYQLAEKAVISSDKKQVDVRLKKGVKWSDGGEVTAADIITTVDAIRKSENVQLRQMMMDINVAALDVYTIRFTFKQKMSDKDLLRKLTFKILPQYKLINLPLTPQSDIARHPVGSGFFQFVERRPTWITLKANESFRHRPGNQEGPHIDSVIMYQIPDPQTQVEDIKDQQVDILVDVPPTAIADLEAARLQTVEYQSLSIQFIAFNQLHPLLRKTAIRQAMTYGFYRANVLEKVFQGKGRLAAGPFSPSSGPYILEVQPLAYDTARADSLLSAVGFSYFDADRVRRNAEGQRLEFSLTTPRYPSGNEYYTRVFNQFISDMSRIGIRVRQIDLETDHFRSAILKDHSYDLAFASLVFDEAGYVAPLFRSGNNQPGEMNFISYSNPDVDKLLDMLDASTKPEEEQNINLRLLRLLRDDCPYLFLWTLNKTAAARQRVRNFVTTVTPFSFFDYANKWYLEE